MDALLEQNPWWADKSRIESDYDIVKWKEKRHHWIPALANLLLEPFALHTLSGPRQCGKTTALKLLIRKELETREPQSIFYFSCENLADHKELDAVLRTYLEFRHAHNIHSSIIILDEITRPSEWFRAIKALVDIGLLRHDVLILTGSTSLAVKRQAELFPGRRGKGKDHVLFPLSFRGFVEVMDPALIQRIPPTTAIDPFPRAPAALAFQKELHHHFESYLAFGGFPLSVATPPGNREDAMRAYLGWIKNAILSAGRSDTVARQIAAVLLETAQTPISWEKIAKQTELKSPKTVAAYIDLLRSIFAVNVLYNIDVSSKTLRFGKNKKIHVRDPLLLDIFSGWCLTEPQDTISAKAEAVAVEHLERLFPGQVSFWRNGHEIDAVVRSRTGLHGFEVKWAERATPSKPPTQLRFSITLTKNEYSRAERKIPLPVFLSMLPL